MTASIATIPWLTVSKDLCETHLNLILNAYCTKSVHSFFFIKNKKDHFLLSDITPEETSSGS
jgi:hypothetical protein